MATTNPYGQVIQIARGSLINRLSSKPLAKGELFIHTSGDVVPTSEVTDLVTNTGIKKIFTGDLFAGANSSKKVYYIGSGQALKWAGITTASTYAEAVEQAQAQPNHIYMYVGTSNLYSTTDSSDPQHLNKKYVASDSTEYSESINPGDLIFYSPVANQVVVIHLSHSTDALTKINVDELISNSMRSLISDFAGENPVTLKTFLDGPARHYQYLSETAGWNPVSGTETSVTTKDVSTGTTTTTVGTITLNEDGDGFIHYVPFDTENPGKKSYKLDGVDDTIYEGDLILSLPDSNGSVRHVVVSLYHALTSKLNLKFNGRADSYATDIWSEGVTDTYVGDKEFFTTHPELQDFIDRLFQSKVDIDPTTHKIISSQIPDWLLGAPKYMGHLKKTTTEWNEISTNTSANDFAKVLLGESTWNNLDESEDTEGQTENSVTDTDAVNEKLKSGCYWIYTGDTIDITSFKNIFCIDGEEDDYDVSIGSPEQDSENGVLSQHLLNKGDWIVYNGEKFETIDNTSSFIGILTNGVKSAGVVDFTETTRDATVIPEVWVNGKSSSVSAQAKETELNATASSISFENPDSVLFKNGSASMVSSDFLPLITDTGYAFSSRFKVLDHQTSIKVADETNSIKFGWSKRFVDEGNLGYIPVSEFNFDGAIYPNTGDTITTRVTDGSTGLDFGLFHWQSADDLSVYKFIIADETTPSVYLPNHSGTLATEEFVNNGFTVVKGVINDVYEALLHKTTKGHVDWLQTVRLTSEKGPDGEYRKEIYDSKLKQTFTDGKSLLLDLFYSIDPDGTYEENTSGAHTRLSTYASLKQLTTDTGFGYYNAPVDYKLGAEDGTTTVVLNPSSRQSTDVPENILPNHSGVLLNSNSVIDGGEW